jgi:two-component system OmpR family response regulator
MKRSLLIADGDAELCYVYQRFLRKQGFEVETASDGLNCLEKLRQGNPGVLVLDRELRSGGGNGVLAWLREKRVLSGVAVVLTTTASFPSRAAEDNEPPTVRFLPKPFRLSALLESVQAAIPDRRQEEPWTNGNLPLPSPQFSSADEEGTYLGQVAASLV